jgi:signal transduction histidine kinase
MIIAFIAVDRKVIKPLKKLSDATKEVSKGNFDIQTDINSNDEIGQLSEDFNKMTNELKGIQVLREDFVSSVSHEFKTPIASIKGYCDLLLQDEGLSEKSSQHINIIHDEISSLSSLSEKVLQLSKLDNMEISIEKEHYYLDEEIRKQIVSLEPLWSKKDIEFDINLSKTKVYLDKDLMNIAIKNLIENAIKFSHQKGKIEVSLNASDEETTLKIKDHGIGMSDDVQEHIFDKFYQGDASHSARGNGLGLSIVKRILDIMDCSIIVNSELDKGSKFKLVIMI